MIYPNFLKKNDWIGVPAPSDGCYDDLKKNKYKQAKKYLKSCSYDVVLSKNIYKSSMGRSASYKVRAQEFNEMYLDEKIDFIMCAAGGDFLFEILPYLDFSKFKDKPKFVAGFSDPTGILYPLTTKCDIASIYGNNFSAFGEVPLGKSQEDFMNIITGNLIKENSYPFYEAERQEKVTGLEPSNLTEPVYWKSLDKGDVDITGRIIGGCLDVINELLGTKYDGFLDFQEKYKNDGIIWYFDNCEQSQEDVLRILWKFKELGYFKYTKGIVFGRFGIEKSYYGYDTFKMLKTSVLNELDIPVIYDADISHKAECLTIINGSISHITCSKGKGSIEFLLN